VRQHSRSDIGDKINFLFNLSSASIKFYKRSSRAILTLFINLRSDTLELYDKLSGIVNELKNSLIQIPSHRLEIQEAPYVVRLFVINHPLQYAIACFDFELNNND
jgi:hypothetical protein